MAKKGRPFVYQSDTEKPVTVSLRLPRDLYARVERYVKMHPGMTLTEFFLDGARLRLDTPADPRDLLLSDDNAVIQEVQEMIRAAVQAEIGELSDFMRPHFSTPAPEAPVEPVPDISHNGNAVIQEEAPRRPGRQSTLRQPIIDLLRAHQEGLTAVQIKVHLRIDKNIGDTLSGMVRQHVITKQGSGKDVRYLAVAAKRQATRQPRKASVSEEHR
jgi:hypothetical protein